MQQNASSKPIKMHVLYIAQHQLDSADEGQNWDTVMFLVTNLEMILMYWKKKTPNFHISPQSLLCCFVNVARYRSNSKHLQTTMSMLLKLCFQALIG